jgi:hypothetical protein
VTKTLRNRVVVRSQYFIENLIEAVGGYKDFDHPAPAGDEREGLVRTW